MGEATFIAALARDSDNRGPFARNHRMGASAAAPVYRLVIFDLDGTLADTVPDIAAAARRALADHGVDGASEENIRLWVGNGSTRTLERALTHEGADVAALLPGVMRSFLKHYGECDHSRSHLYDGVATTLDALRAQGCRLAVCTNKSREFVRPALEAFGIADRFAMLVGAGDTRERKPHPEPLLKIAAELGVPPAHCLMVGDSINDFEAARASGMDVVLVRGGYNQGVDLAALQPDALLDSLRELPDWVAARQR
jgi:phosphoglycolate phosphatase